MLFINCDWQSQNLLNYRLIRLFYKCSYLSHQQESPGPHACACASQQSLLICMEAAWFPPHQDKMPWGLSEHHSAYSGDHPTGTSTHCCFHFSIIFLKCSLQNWDAIQVMAPILLYIFLVISCFAKPPNSSLSPCIPQGARGRTRPRRPPKSFAQPLISPSVPR